MEEEKVQEKILLKFYVEIIKIQNDPNIKVLPPRLVRGLLESMEQRTTLEYIEFFFRYQVKSSGYLPQKIIRIESLKADLFINKLMLLRVQHGTDNKIARIKYI